MQRAISRISLALGDEFELFIVFFGTENPGFSFGGELVHLDVAGSLKTGVLSKIRFFLKRRRLLQQFIVDNNIEVLASFGEPANFLCFLVKAPKKIFSVRTSIDKSLPGFYGCIYRYLVRFVYPFAPRNRRCF